MTVIPFPTSRPRRATNLSDPAVILVLPAIRIERYDDELVSEAVERDVRRSIDLFRHAREGAPAPLDEPGGPV